MALVFLAHGAARAQDATALVEPTPVAAVPLSDVPTRAEQVASLIRGIEESLRPRTAILAIEEEVPRTTDEVAQRIAATEAILAAQPSGDQLISLESDWKSITLELTKSIGEVRRRSAALEEDLTRLDRLRLVWRRTAESADAGQAPEAILAVIAATREALKGIKVAVLERQGEILTLQQRIASVSALTRAQQRAIAEARVAFVGSLFFRNSPPIWQWSALSESGSSAERVAVAARQQASILRDYLSRQPQNLLALIVGTLLVGLMLLRARRTARRWVEEEPKLANIAEAFRLPFSTAVLLGTLAIPWVFQRPPSILLEVAGAIALLPALRLLARYVPPAQHSSLYALGAFYIVDRFRALLTGARQIELTVFLLELCAAIFLLTRAPGGGPVDTSTKQEKAPRARVVRAVRRTMALLLGVAAGAIALGYTSLGRLLGDGVFRSAYTAVLLVAAAQGATALWTYALHGRMSKSLRFVRNYRWLLQRRGRKLINFAAALTWLILTLRYLAVFTFVVDAAQDILAARYTQGNVSVSLGDVLTFALSVWSAVLISRFLRFVLAEDVFPRTEMGHGVPYALSSLLHYALIIGGFLFGVAAIGFDMGRFTIVAGALGVGIGFGMQNVVNNFVSGLILLFERPIKVGDAIELSALSGEVRRIGIRSSTIRTWDGADVIVPNGMLISDTLTNWTLSDRMKRIEIDVGVAYGTEPERVLAILRQVATDHPGAVRTPPPAALFLAFGNSSLDFRLRVWTARYEEWINMRSELVVAISRALREAEIEIPFPQHDLHVRSFDAAALRQARATADPAAPPRSTTDES